MKTLLAMTMAAMLAAAAPDRADVADLAWMGGRWETADGDRWTDEVWLSPRGGLMVGLSRSGQGDAAREFEFLRIQAGEDGVPVYWASPGGRPPVGFRLVEADSTSAIFENPEHDFPQRIHYRRDGDRLVATISARDGSNAMSWTYRRRQ